MTPHTARVVSAAGERMANVTLTEFLLARIAEDEAAARDATAGPWWDQEASRVYSKGEAWAQGPWQHNAVAVCENFDLPQNRANGAHIARHDPARVLAECEAKRRIVERSSALAESIDLNVSADARATLRDLAAVYADHPDYREEWR